ncbi:hypothetical protein C9374_000813 [Naegleria lovaniensis]|uniref:Serine/threonine-protein kinase ATR n=1 Tax=Naegleria lovaniensis TaxID=51637 RepID=A0AA88GX33_NAELO|nr:uncharacterized protein C9374_000813 [Naegleria lovaniensis]KAG2387963.1 hypothetical protein C9374_000813 [Naegleria lovaniensis]
MLDGQQNDMLVDNVPPSSSEVDLFKSIRFPFLKQLQEYFSDYVTDDETKSIKAANQILTCIKFSECLIEQLQQEDVESISVVIEIISNILDVKGKDLVSQLLLREPMMILLVADSFRLLAHTHQINEISKQLLDLLVVLQEFLFQHFPSIHSEFIGDLCKMISQLYDINLFFCHNNAELVDTSGLSILFLPTLFKKFYKQIDRICMIPIPFEKTCTDLQKFILSLLKVSLEKHPILFSQHRQIFTIACQQVRFSSNEIKIMALELIYLLCVSQNFEPTIHKFLINLLVTIFNVESNFPLYRTMEFDDLLAKILKNFRPHLLNVLESFGVERMDMLGILSKNLFANISQSKSDALKKEIIRTICWFMDYSINNSHFELVFSQSLVKDINDCFKYQAYHDELVHLLRKILLIHYAVDGTPTLKRKESQIDASEDSSAKKRKGENGEETQISEDPTNISITYSPHSAELGSRFFVLEYLEQSDQFFETLKRAVSHLSHNDIHSLYILIMSIAPFNHNKDNVILGELITLFSTHLKNTLEYSEKCIRIIDTLLENEALSGVSIEIVNDITSFSITMLELYAKQMDQDILDLTVKNLSRLSSVTDRKEVSLILKELLAREEKCKRAFVNNLPFMIKLKQATFEEVHSSIRALFNDESKSFQECIYRILPLTIEELMKSGYRLEMSHWDFFLHGHKSSSTESRKLSLDSILLFFNLMTKEDLETYGKRLDFCLFAFDENVEMVSYAASKFSNWIYPNSHGIIPIDVLYGENSISLLVNNIKEFLKAHASTHSRYLIPVLRMIFESHSTHTALISDIAKFFLDLAIDFQQCPHVYIAVKKLSAKEEMSVMKFMKNKIGDEFFNILFQKWDSPTTSSYLQAVAPSLFDLNFSTISKRILRKVLPEIVVSGELRSKSTKLMSMTNSQIRDLLVDHMEKILSAYLKCSFNPIKELGILTKEWSVPLEHHWGKFSLGAIKHLVMELGFNKETDAKVINCIKQLAEMQNKPVPSVLSSSISGITIMVAKCFKKSNVEKQKRRVSIIPSLLKLLDKEIIVCQKALLELFYNVLFTCSFKEEIFPVFDELTAKLEKHCPDTLLTAFSHLCELVDDSNFGKQLKDNLVRMLTTKTVDPTKVQIPSSPLLSELHDIINKALGGSFEKRIEALIKGIEQSEVTIKRNSLLSLTKVLSENKSKIQKIVLSMFDQEYNSSNIINRMVTSLLTNCSHIDDKIKTLSAIALSELGAIDPSVLNIESANIGNPEKGDVELLDFLIRYIENCPATSNHANYARQELMKVLFDADSKYLKDNFKDYLSLKEQGLSLKHQKVQPNVKKANSLPIFKENMQHHTWLKNWSKYLVTRSETRSIRGRTFQAVRPLFNSDKELVKIVFPYLVHNVLMTGTDKDREDIKQEIMSVISYDVSKSHIGEQYRTSEHAQTIFCLIDDLKRWFESNKHFSAYFKEMAKKAETIINDIPLDSLASTAYNHSAFSRSLMYFESFIRKMNKPISELPSEVLHNLQRIYSELKERDSMAGIAALRTETNINESILDKEVEGRWEEARDLYGIMLEQNLDNVDILSNLMKCYINLSQYTTLLHIIQGSSLDKNSKASFAIQAYWRLCSWSSVDSVFEDANQSFEAYLAKALSSYVRKEKEQFETCIQLARKEILPSLSAASTESYLRCYPDIIKLQALSELERGFKIFLNDDGNKNIATDISEFVGILDKNLKITTSSSANKELLFAMRRCLFTIHNLNDQVYKTWVHISKQARKEKQYGMALHAITHAINYHVPQKKIEQAKLLYEMGESQSALSLLSTFTFDTPNMSLTQTKRDSLMKAKIKLMSVNWEKEHKSKDVVIEGYNQVIKLDRNWEEGYFYLASYLDNIFIARREKERDTQHVKSELPMIIQNYGTSLQYGVKNIYNSLPRLITLWLDFSGADDKKNSVYKKVQPIIDKLINDLPVFEWTIAMPQLVSRMVNKNDTITDSITRILVKILITFPEESIWSIGCKSDHKERQNVIDNIIETAKNQIASSDSPTTKVVKSILDQQESTLEGLRQMCMVFFGNNGKYSLSSAAKKKGSETKILIKVNGRNEEKLQPLPQLAKLINKPSTNFIVPLQRLTTVELQKANLFTEDGELKSDYSPYSSSKVYITSFKDEVSIMTSMQKPKKIGIYGNDGNLYNFLFKSNDDLRKDNRMMDFNSVINRLLKRDELTRNKRLYLRVFSVIPLSVNTGLVEWVENTNVLRNILDNEINNIGFTNNIQAYISNTFLKGTKSNAQDFAEQVYKTITTQVPPVLHNFFLHQFLEPNQWYQSRLNFVRTTAVWSMVGYIVGLGDRHCENILIDLKCGDVIHVDLAMLFETGKYLAIPEKVPFRLTRNVVDGMGVTGHEGVFRFTCEATLEILRKNHQTLMNVLDSFIHDPLLDWKQLAQKKEAAKISRCEEDMEGNYRNIEKKLKGLIGDNVLPLSVQGQVDHLIKEATNEANLIGMFIWWMPYM